MVSLFFFIVKVSIVIVIQAKVLKKDLLPIGSRCSFDSDCYTDNCSLTISKSFKSCISKNQNLPSSDMAPLFSRPNPTFCILTNHYCTTNDDCCSQVCKHIIFTKLNYCQIQADDVPYNINYELTNPTPNCSSNGKSCFDNDQCCSHKCSFHFGSYKTICMPEV